MPYREQNNCVQENKSGKWVNLKCYDNHADALKYLKALEANVPDAHKELEEYLTEKATDYDKPENWAFVPDAKHPSGWKLKIGDRKHVGLAIAALKPSSEAPHGQGVKDIPDSAMAGVKRRIRAAIGKYANDEKDKKEMLAELSAVKSLDDEEVAKQIQRPTQAESAYTTLSIRPGEACANCRWFDNADGGYCHVIANYPADILPTGWCERWEVKPVMPEPIPMQPSMSPYSSMGMPSQPQLAPSESELEGPVLMSLSESEEVAKHDHPTGISFGHEQPDIGYIAPDSAAENVLKALIARFKGGLKPGQTVIKGSDGKRLMLIVTSNSYQDREGETITTDALKSYVDNSWTRVEDQFTTNNKALFWHDDRVIMGDIVWADMRGPFLVELAKENNAPLSRYLFNYREAHPDEKWAASHRFAYYRAHKDEDGTYHRIQKRETSILPREAAANALTFSGVIPMTSKRDEFLNKMLGLENAAELLDKGMDVLVAELQKQGIEHKSVEDKPTESANPFGNLLSDMIKAQAEMAEQLDALVTENKALKTANDQIAADNKALTARVDHAEKALDGRPRQASQATETEIKASEVAEEVRRNLTKRSPVFNLEVSE